MRYPIHISDVRSFLQCRRKWDWSSPLRRGLEKDVTYAPFYLGKMIHHSLQMYYENGQDLVQAAEEYIDKEKAKLPTMWESELEIIQTQNELGFGMLDHYSAWAPTEKGMWSDKNLRFISLETPFAVPLRTDNGTVSPRVFLEGRLDGVVQRLDDGSLWIWETKTTRSIEELKDSLANDNQAGAYIYAMQEMLQRPISGVLYNILRKKVPTMPSVLKNGYLQQRADADTTAEFYFATAKAHHCMTQEQGREMYEEGFPDGMFGWTEQQVLEHYKPYLDTLLLKGNTFFARVPVYRTPGEIKSLSGELWTIAKEMVRSSTPIYAAPSWMSCRFCSFRAPCLARNAGADDEFIIDNEYRKRKTWEEESEEQGYAAAPGGKRG